MHDGLFGTTVNEILDQEAETKDVKVRDTGNDTSYISRCGESFVTLDVSDFKGRLTNLHRIRRYPESKTISVVCHHLTNN